METTLQSRRPQTREELKNYVIAFLGMDVPDKKICEGHCAPMDYLWYGFSCDYKNHGQDAHATAEEHGRDGHATSGDCIVWANRGGGKTQLAAALTLLDSVFKPNCQTRILGGSLEQSSRMYEYLVNFAEANFADAIKDRALAGKCRFKNKSRVEVLTQSSRNVRGRHVQKLRCDEVELFDEDILTAAQFVPNSKDGIVASMEIISTMHRPYGLMQKAVAHAQQNHTPIFQWCLWEVIEQCVDRNCSQCPLWGDCGGRAKNAAGFLAIDDCIAQMQRSSRAAWESEMLCLRPSLENAVFAEFDLSLHVRPVEYNPNLPLYRAIDFGFVNPFVCLWIQVDNDGVVRILDEYIRSKATIDMHALAILNWRVAQPPSAVISSSIPKPIPITGTFCDPAGAGVNDVNGSSAVRELRKLSINCRYRKSSILEGIELIRRALRNGRGESTLIISPRCKTLIESLRCYHYPDTTTIELPVKDGVYDHPIDALRYFFVNRFGQSSKVVEIRY
jgi:hypothetical protein